MTDEIYSPTSIKAFLHCPQKYKFKYIDKISGEHVSDKSSYLGQIYHKFLSKYYLELYNGKTYKVFTNTYLTDIINSIPLWTISKCTVAEANELKLYAFNNLIISYLGKKPNCIPKTIDGNPMVEYEAKNIPIVNIETGEIMSGATLQCRYDLITNNNEIKEFKLVNMPFHRNRLQTDIQMTIQSYIFTQLFDKAPNGTYFEFMIKNDNKGILDTRQAYRSSKHYKYLWNIISTIREFKERNLWYKSYPNGCIGCGYFNICFGG